MGCHLPQFSEHIFHAAYYFVLGGSSHMHYSHGGASAYPYLFSCEASILQHCHFHLNHSSRATRPCCPENLQQHTYGFLQHTYYKSLHSFGKGTWNIHFQDIALLSIRRLSGEVVFYIHIYVSGYHRRLFIPAIYTFVLMLHFLSTQSEHR